MFQRPLLILLTFVVLGVGVAAIWPRSAPPAVEEPSSRGSEPPEAARFHNAYQQALARRIDWNYVDMDLVEIARGLGARLELPVEVDPERATNLPWTKKLTLVATNLSVRNGLEYLLQYTLLTFVPYDGKLFITNDAFANGEKPLIVRRYSVPDLRQPVVDANG